MSESKFPVEILVPEGNVFKGDVDMLVTRTTVGDVGIKANHTPFMAMLEPTELRLHIGDEIKRFAQGDGYLQVYANHAEVLVEEALKPEELDAVRLREQIGEADSRLAEAEEGTAAYTRATRDKARWETFLALATSE